MPLALGSLSNFSLLSSWWVGIVNTNRRFPPTEELKNRKLLGWGSGGIRVPPSKRRVRAYFWSEKGTPF